MAYVPGVAGLYGQNRVPDVGVVLEKHAGRAALSVGVGAVLVQRVARPGASGRRVGAGPVERDGGAGAVGDEPREGPASHDSVDAGDGGGRGARERSAVAGGVSRLR